MKSNTVQAKEITGKITAKPNPLSLGQNRVLISWQTNDPAGAEVRVSTAPDTEKLVSQGKSGETSIPWIVDSTVYEFRLYALSQPNAPIDAVHVRKAIESAPKVLRDIAEEALRGNIDMGEVSRFIADIVPTCLHSTKFREFFPIWEQHGFHITPVHFYQPIPNAQTLPKELWESPSTLPGIDTNDPVQLNLVTDAFPKFRSEYEQLPQEPVGVPGSFYLNNGLFDGMDALVAYCMVRHFKPRLIIEVGSGFSSVISAEAATKNEESALICIEPSPADFLKRGFPGLRSLIEKEVQQVDIEFFSQLGANDILFIDSSHTVKIGGDVNYLFLEVLPRLNPGVIVHVHDIFLTFSIIGVTG